MAGACAIYRFPRQRQVTMVAAPLSRVVLQQSVAGIGDKSAFVIAPFQASAGQPVVMIEPNEVRQWDDVDAMQLPAMEWNFAPTSSPSGTVDEAHYNKVFAAFHDQLQRGVCEKLVLARTMRVPCDTASAAVPMFVNACKRYPDAFVTLFSAPQCGTWLIATPEVLLQCEQPAADVWHTMALAGTRSIHDTTPWSTKNREEQQVVASYITRCLEPFASGEISCQGPNTVTAGNVAHLRTDFRFTLDPTADVGSLIDTLHPTPAVCGMPKQRARDFIVAHEGIDRAYYSGYSGPWNIAGERRLFVSLRCMQLLQDGCILYAGGGLLTASNPADEWRETQAKLQTMSSLFTQ